MSKATRRKRLEERLDGLEKLYLVWLERLNQHNEEGWQGNYPSELDAGLHIEACAVALLTTRVKINELKYDLSML